MNHAFQFIIPCLGNVNNCKNRKNNLLFSLFFNENSQTITEMYFFFKHIKEIIISKVFYLHAMSHKNKFGPISVLMLFVHQLFPSRRPKIFCY